MKKIIYICTVLLILPIVGWSQPLISNLGPDAKERQEQRMAISESDLIVPVLMRPQVNGANFDNSIQKLFTEKPGLAFLSSGILPGSGQLANKNWIRGGIYAALEAVAVYMVIEYDNRGTTGKRRYENYADQNWSVTQYAKWLVDYHDANGLENSALADLRDMVEGLDPTFDTSIDWNNIDIDILREVERRTRFVTPDNLSNSNFSHILPAYGSQQYYELISKYYQFQSGWQDYYGFHEANSTSPFLISRNGNYASDMFFKGASLADAFNNDLRTSKNFRLVLIANHVLSAFDSFFTFKLKQNRIEAATSMAPAEAVKLSVNF